MGLKSTRKILSVLFAIVIALSVVFGSFAGVFSSTYGSRSFVIKHFVTNEIVAECDKQLDIKYEALEKKCGIPARVFEMVKTRENTADTLKKALSNVFNENDSTLNSSSRVDYFYDICVEYLDGNKLKYDEQNVRNVAKEAALIYSDSVGIHNFDEIKQYISDVDSKCARVESTSALVLVVAAVMILVMYKKKPQAYGFFGSGVLSGGVAILIGGIVAFSMRSKLVSTVYPTVYQTGIDSMAKSMTIWIVLIGALSIVIGLAIVLTCAYLINLEETRKNTRFSKIVAKL